MNYYLCLTKLGEGRRRLGIANKNAFCLALRSACTTFAPMKGDRIIIKGARENNLKEVSLEIPKHQITVFTGVSGSGKSSLVLDTIAAKSRRELNDTFPSFVQQYLPKYGRPHVDAIENLPIAIVIDQKKPAQNSRSTQPECLINRTQ